MADRIQMELDAFEKSALELVFGRDYQSNQKYMWISKFFPDVIQKRIDSFEQFMRPLMNDDGQIDGSMLKSIAGDKLGSFKSVIPDKPFYLSDLSSTAKMIFLGERQ